MNHTPIITRHHICAKAAGGALKEPDNIKLLEQKFHRRFHDLFGIKLPHEQLEMVIDIAKTALSPGVHQDMTDVLQAYKGQMYKPWVYDESKGLIIPNPC